MKSLLTEKLSAEDEKYVNDLFKKQFNKAIEKLIETEVKKQLKDKATEKEVKAIVSSALIKFFSVLWNRSSFWAKDL